MKPEYEALPNLEKVILERESLFLIKKLAEREYEMLLEKGHLKAWVINQKMNDFEQEANESDLTFAELANIRIQENFCDAESELAFYRENGWSDEEINCVTDVLSEARNQPLRY